MTIERSPADGATSANTNARTPLLADFYTRKQLAAELKRNERTLIRWHALRIGPPACKIGGQLLYKRSDVLAWIEGQKVAA